MAARKTSWWLIECDGCGRALENGDDFPYLDKTKDGIEGWATGSGWKSGPKGWRCENCECEEADIEAGDVPATRGKG